MLFYNLMRAGNLVNVTSLFYLAPVVTAVMDYLVLGNRLAPLGLAGMVSILAGLVLIFRAAPAPKRQALKVSHAVLIPGSLSGYQIRTGN